MEIKVSNDILKILVADHLNRQIKKRIHPKDVHLYYDNMCEEVTHAYTFIDDELED